ncbi:uncharacterized protein LOC111019169 [Momordica charantia]|uniref:Uncharacterized protein LOC111019169 n=1 Tax=Momordica charantia TaxID=3673 RepID=A0A6J1DCT2_MOMCH|nr:uncharacterized protein LOC111019169 [Momordica charantia]
MRDPVEEVVSLEMDPPEEIYGADDYDDFSFVCSNPDGSPISAEDAFVNGQIRPVFPVFDQRLLFSQTKAEETTSLPLPVRVRPQAQLKKLFMEDEELRSDTQDLTRVAPEIYCEWSPRKVGEAAPELGKKSYSTGFSKLWRFGDRIRRSSSDGKEAFVFLRSPSSGGGGEAKLKANGGSGSGSGSGRRTKGERETASCYHERHYARNRAENEMNKRKSYLPYRSNLVGFFTSVNNNNNNNNNNGLTRNPHSF